MWCAKYVATYICILHRRAEAVWVSLAEWVSENLQKRNYIPSASDSARDCREGCRNLAGSGVVVADLEGVDAAPDVDSMDGHHVRGSETPTSCWRRPNCLAQNGAGFKSEMEHKESGPGQGSAQVPKGVAEAGLCYRRRWCNHMASTAILGATECPAAQTER